VFRNWRENISLDIGSYPFLEGDSPKFHRESCVCCWYAQTNQSRLFWAHPVRKTKSTSGRILVWGGLPQDYYKHSWEGWRVGYNTFRPIRRFSGLISRWITCFSWQYIRARAREDIYCALIQSVVFSSVVNNATLQYWDFKLMVESSCYSWKVGRDFDLISISALQYSTNIFTSLQHRF